MLNPKELQDRVLSGADNEDKIIVMIATLMRDLNISYSDMMNMPIPAYLSLIKARRKVLIAENKRRIKTK